MSEMSDQTRGVLFVVLVVAITFVWFSFPPPAAVPTAEARSELTADRPGTTCRDRPRHRRPPPPPAPAKRQGQTREVIPAVQASAEKFIDVESGLYRVRSHSNNGAVVRSWKLKKYLDDENPPRPLDLANSDVSEQLGWPFSLMLSDKQLEKQANSALYEVTAGEAHTGVPGKSATPPAGTLEAPATVNFHWSDGHLDVTKKLSFTEDYQLSVEASVSLDGRPVPCAIAWRGGFGDKGVYKASQLVSVFFQQAGKVNLLQYKKLWGSREPGPAPRATWRHGVCGHRGSVLFRGVYSGWRQLSRCGIGPTGITSVRTSNPKERTGGGDGGRFRCSPEPVKLHARISVRRTWRLLAKVRPSLEGLVNFGWFSTISKALLFALQWLHRYISNWGWAIVILTLVINFAVFPAENEELALHARNAEGGAGDEIDQDRYKKYSMTDPRRKKMQEEIAELYQRHGINPLASLGGCVPMLVQMPIWWALWRVLTGAIELRHAPWVFWIRDLSVRDPYYILPIAMAITMYLMTKMTPQTAAVDPAQQKMMTLMPLMFAAFFFTYASGLNLYMFTSNLVGVDRQQWYLNRTRPLPSPK